MAQPAPFWAHQTCLLLYHYPYRPTNQPIHTRPPVQAEIPVLHQKLAAVSDAELATMQVGVVLPDCTACMDYLHAPACSALYQLSIN